MYKTFAAFLMAGAGISLWGQNSAIDSSAMQAYEARAISVSGQVSYLQDKDPWAVSAGTRIAVRRYIMTGPDGFAHFEVSGGSSFDLFSNSRVVFRKNPTSPEDLLDVVSGRVKIHLNPTIGQLQLRVFCPAAVITTHEPTTIAIAIDEDETARVDIMEGEIGVHHLLFPRSDAMEVKAIDAILIQKDQPISRRVDRGSLYRYTIKSLHDIWAAITPGHSGGRSGEPIEGSKFLAEAKSMRQNFF